jgi:hypothetical protein
MTEIELVHDLMVVFSPGFVKLLYQRLRLGCVRWRSVRRVATNTRTPETFWFGPTPSSRTPRIRIGGSISSWSATSLEEPAGP